MSKVAVVIPTYKDELNPLEKISLAQCRKILGSYPLIFVAPEGKNFSYFAPTDKVVHLPSQFFQSVATYNRLMMLPQFYKTFADFDYILIHQLDAFVFYDALKDFCSLGYDYIGAPWPHIAWFSLRNKKTPRVGNGGFSLRKVAACHKLLSKLDDLPISSSALETAVEDSFFALCGVTEEINFSTAPVEIAAQFSMEHYPARCVKRLGGKIPFGCHGWNIFSADFYVEIFAQVGWDLRPFRNIMGNEDYRFQLPLGLTKLALTRLIRRIERGQSLIRYLPTKRFASINILRDPDAMKILAQLLMEENFLADKIFLYDKPEDLIHDLPREELPHLLITAEYDENLIDALERRGMIYGRHVISFRREYMRRCEKLFHELGK